VALYSGARPSEGGIRLLCAGGVKEQASYLIGLQNIRIAVRNKMAEAEKKKKYYYYKKKEKKAKEVVKKKKK